MVSPRFSHAWDCHTNGGTNGFKEFWRKHLDGFSVVDYSKIRLTSHLYPLQDTSKTMVHHQVSWVVNHQFVRWPFRKTVLGFTGCSHWQLLVENSCAYAKIKQHVIYIYIQYICIFISNIQNVNHSRGWWVMFRAIIHKRLDQPFSTWFLLASSSGPVGESSIGPWERVPGWLLGMEKTGLLALLEYHTLGNNAGYISTWQYIT